MRGISRRRAWAARRGHAAVVLLLEVQLEHVAAARKDGLLQERKVTKAMMGALLNVLWPN